MTTRRKRKTPEQLEAEARGEEDTTGPEWTDLEVPEGDLAAKVFYPKRPVFKSQEALRLIEKYLNSK